MQFYCKVKSGKTPWNKATSLVCVCGPVSASRTVYGITTEVQDFMNLFPAGWCEPVSSFTTTSLKLAELSITHQTQ